MNPWNETTYLGERVVCLWVVVEKLNFCFEIRFNWDDTIIRASDKKCDLIWDSILDNKIFVREKKKIIIS